jgi:Ca2+-binding EF-hand superfamily protein
MKSSAKTVFEIILAITFVLAIAATPIAAQAQGMQKHSPVPFAQFDADDDGFVSEDEFNSTRAQHMAEMAAAGRPMKGAATAPAFSDLDANGDSKLSETELVAGQKAHMMANQGRHKNMGKRMGKGKCKGKESHGRKSMDHMKDQDSGANMPTFEDIDTDGDGSISRDEFATHQASHHGSKH